MANLPTTMEYFDNLLGEQLTEGGGSSWQTVFEGSVTTHDDDGEIFGIIENLTLNGNSIRVTFNGAVYELPKTEHGYGAENDSGIDFSTYPLFIATGGSLDSCTLWTLTAGTYSLKIEEPQSGGSSDFSVAFLTISSQSSLSFQLTSCVLINGQPGERYFVANDRSIAPQDGTLVLNVPLLDGYWECEYNPVEGITLDVVGNGEANNGIISITGDCNITIS